MALSKEKTKLLARLRNPRFRGGEGQFLVEGVRGAEEFLGGRIHRDVRFAVVSRRLEGTQGGRRLRDLLRSATIPVEEVSDEELDAVSDTEQTQGVILVVREAGPEIPPAVKGSFERVLLLDGIQDPGNAGTLVRAGRAFGLTRAIALEGTVDLFNPKVVRASAGTLAHFPVHRSAWLEAATWLIDGDIPLLVGGGGGKDVRAVSVPSRWALAVGNEGAGCRPELLEAATEVVGIPMEYGVDSLNAGVAGAILMFALNRPQLPAREN